MFRNLLLLLTLMTPVATYGSVLRIALVVDTADSQSFSSVSLAKKGLIDAEKEFNIFAQVVEIQDSINYIDRVKDLASKGFHLVIGVGSRATDTICYLAPQFQKIKFTLVDSYCSLLTNINTISFDSMSIADAITQFVQVHQISPKVKIAWVEEQSSPNLNFIRGQVLRSLSVGREQAEIEVLPVDNDQLLPLISQVSASSYDGVVVIAGSAIQKRWLRHWPKGKNPLLLSGPGSTAAGMRLVKRFDTVVYQTIKSLNDGHKTPQKVTYSFADGGLELLYSRQLDADNAYRKVFDIVTRPNVKAPAVN